MKIALELAPGIVSDDTDFANGGWSGSSGVRFHRGKPESTAGWELLSPDALTGVCRSIHSWTDGDGLQTFAFGLHNGLTVWQAGAQADITPASGFTPGQIDGTGSAGGFGTGGYGIGDYGEPSPDAYYALTWSFGVRSFGELYANPRGQGIFKWDNDTGTEAATLTNAPAVCNFLLMAFTDQVMAFGCTDTGGNFNQAVIRISDAELPTEWTPGTATTAQQIYLQGNGRIVGARNVGRYVLVWTDSELHIGSFSTEWSFERVASGCGLCSPGGVAILGQTAFWLTPDLQPFAYTLGGSPASIPCPIQTELKDNAASSQNDKIVAGTFAEKSEVVWSYADARDGSGYECSRFIRLSTVDGSWSTDELARTAYVDSGPSPSPVATTFDGTIYWQERGESGDGSPLSAYIETGGQYLDPGQKVLMARGVWPDFTNFQGSMTLNVQTKMYPQDDWYDWGDFTYNRATNRVDFTAQGRIFKFKFTSWGSPMQWRMGKPVFDVVATSDH